MTTLNASQIATVAYGAGFRGSALTTAVAVALAESSGRVEVVNSIGCVGLWQINQPVHTQWTTAELQNAATNAAAAYSISNAGADWTPWQTYTTGKYLAEVGAAQLGVAQIGTQVTTTGSTTADPTSALGDLGGILGGLADGVAGDPGGNVLGGIDSIATMFIGGAEWISNGHNWLRILEVIGGTVAIFIGLKMLADSGINSPVAAAVEAPAKAARATAKGVKSAAKDAAETAAVAA